MRQLLLMGPIVALRAFLPATAQVFIAAAALALLAHAVQAPMTWTSAVWASAAVYAAVLAPVPNNYNSCLDACGRLEELEHVLRGEQTGFIHQNNAAPSVGLHLWVAQETRHRIGVGLEST